MSFRLFLVACYAFFGPVFSLFAGEPLLFLSDELEQVTGKRIELRASPAAYGDRSLPQICEVLARIFREAAEDAGTRSLLNRIVRSIVIDEFYVGDDKPHVDLANTVLTVQCMNSNEAAKSLHPQIRQVLRDAGVKFH